MKKILFMSALAAFFSILSVSCSTDVIGGTVNDPDQFKDMTLWQWIEANEPEVAYLFEKGGYKDMLNDPDEDILLISPTRFAVNRYIRRHNLEYRQGLTDVQFTLADIEADEAKKMSMYIFKGAIGREDLEKENNRFLTAIDDSTEIRFSLDETNTDPGSAYDGGNNPGVAFQYSNFLQDIPDIFHVQFKRGDNWEFDASIRETLTYENSECDQRYRMYVSNIVTKNGIAHLIYSGDSSNAEHRYYHSLFFYGNIAADGF